MAIYRNLYRKSSFRSCPYTVLVKCPVQFYSIFDEIGQKVDGKMYFYHSCYHKSNCSTTTTESKGSDNGSVFSALAPANGYAQKTDCAERFSALNIYSISRPGRLFNFGPMRLGAYSRVVVYYFSQHFQQAKTFLENNETRDNKTKQSAKLT